MSLPPSYNLLTRHPNRVYLETGIFRGDSIQQAIDAGFQRIIGIELFQENVDFCLSRFHGRQENIQFLCGDSALHLWDVIKHITEPVTFFLDSHSQLLEDEPPIANPFPLLKELEQINYHPVRSHTIIIDDILYMTHPEVTGWSKARIENILYQINSKYTIEYVANPVKSNLLIARI